MNLNEIWDNALEIIKDEVNAVSYTTWYAPLKIVAYHNDVVYLETADKFIRDLINQRHNSFIKNTIEVVLKKETDVVFTLPGESISFKNLDEQKNTETPEESNIFSNPNRKLNAKYRFDSFITGGSNRLAQAASLAVAESPGTIYNPLFLYGDVGLGKTHLMHAIGHYILDCNPDSQVMYVTSEKFTNDLINSIKNGKNEEFRNKYRKLDVLLIDDIQFIVGKERTQEEFFHTFNTLYGANKQIIISSDNPPDKIPTLEQRLSSRFQMGLTVDIQAPDYETRIAILRKKAETENHQIPDDVIAYIAKNIQSNIRNLEGALIRIIAYSSLYSKDVDLELAQEALKTLVSSNSKIITIKDVQEKVADYFSISVEELNSKIKSKNIAYPRQIAMYISRNLTDQSLPQIGRFFGGRDHSTVVHAYNKISDDIITNKELKNKIDDIISILKN